LKEWTSGNEVVTKDGEKDVTMGQPEQGVNEEQETGTQNTHYQATKGNWVGKKGARVRRSIHDFQR